MTRTPALVSTLILAATAAFGQLQLQPGYPLPLDPVGRNELVNVHFNATSGVDEHDVVVDFTVNRGSIASITSQALDCAASGARAHCSAQVLKGNTYNDIALVVHTPDDLSGGKLTVGASISAATGAGMARGWDIVLRRYFLVTTTEDGGFGSLRQAMADANGCQACEIDFQIPPPVPERGWFTITPRRELPPIDALLVIIDGHTQTAFTGDTNPRGPEIEINGSQCGCFGLKIAPLSSAGVRQITIRNLVVNGFAGPGFFIISDRLRSASYVTVSNNYIGTDPTGTVAVPNLRGLMSYDTSFIEVRDNVISGNLFSGVWIWSGNYPYVARNAIGLAADGVAPLGNGASGVFFGPEAEYGAADDNKIAYNRDFGVAVSPQAQWIEVRGNSMKENGQSGIDWGLDLSTPNVSDDSHRTLPNAPLLTSARFDPVSGTTLITGHLDAQKPASVGWNTFLIDIYRSSALDAHGMAQGEEALFPRRDWQSAVDIDANGDFKYAFKGDLTHQYLTATVTRFYGLGKGPAAESLTPKPLFYESWQSTSEFSAPLHVAP